MFFNEESRWKTLITVKYPRYLDIPKFGNQVLKNVIMDTNNPFWKNVMSTLYYFNEHFCMTSEQKLEA